MTDKGKVGAAIRDDIRAVTSSSGHEEGSDIGHHGRNADCAVFCQAVYFLYRNAEVIEPFCSNFLTGTFLHGLFDIIAGNISKQRVYPYAYLFFILVLELSLAVDGPA